MTGIFGYLT